MYQVEVTGISKEELQFLIRTDPYWIEMLEEEGKLKRVEGYKPYSQDKDVYLVNVHTDEDFFENLNSYFIFPDDEEADEEEESETETET